MLNILNANETLYKNKRHFDRDCHQGRIQWKIDKLSDAEIN